MKNNRLMCAAALGIIGILGTTYASAAGISGALMVKEIRMFNGDGGAVVTLDGTIPTACGAKSSFRITHETLVRAIHAAYLAGRPIKVQTTDSCANIFDNVSEVYF